MFGLARKLTFCLISMSPQFRVLVTAPDNLSFLHFFLFLSLFYLLYVCFFVMLFPMYSLSWLQELAGGGRISYKKSPLHSVQLELAKISVINLLIKNKRGLNTLLYKRHSREIMRAVHIHHLSSPLLLVLNQNNPRIVIAGEWIHH